MQPLPRPSDTSADAWEVMIGIYAAMTPQRKLELVEDASRSVRQLAWAGVNQRHPDESLARRRRRLLGLLLGEDLATRAYGDLEDHS